MHAQFKYHLEQGQHLWRASQQRFDGCQRLIAEMQVQALAIDSARENVDVHYQYILRDYTDFRDSFEKENARQADMIESFPRVLQGLKEVVLHPRLHNEGYRTLADCIDLNVQRKVAGDCTLSHEQFGRKVGELNDLFGELKANVDALFMTGPTIDISALEAQLEEKRQLVEEESSILQSFAKDVQTVGKLVQEAVRQLTMADLQSSVRPLDACGALDPMNEVHISTHLPRIRSCDKTLEKFHYDSWQSKNAMTNSVHAQLLAISTLQSRIRDMKNKLVAFREVGDKQKEAFVHLQLVQELPAAYFACLSEVVRRRANADLYQGQAMDLAEKLAALRAKENSRAEAFAGQIQRLLPRNLLQLMGLLEPLPACEVTVPSVAQNLLDVNIDDLPSTRPMPQLSAGLVAAARACDLDGDGGRDPMADLQLENSKLRAEAAALSARLFIVAVGRGGEEVKLEASKKLDEAVNLKQQHIAFLEGTLQEQKKTMSRQQERIRQLEAQLLQMSATSETNTKDAYVDATGDTAVNTMPEESKVPSPMVNSYSETSNSSNDSGTSVPGDCAESRPEGAGPDHGKSSLDTNMDVRDKTTSTQMDEEDMLTALLKIGDAAQACMQKLQNDEMCPTEELCNAIRCIQSLVPQSFPKSLKRMVEIMLIGLEMRGGLRQPLGRLASSEGDLYSLGQQLGGTASKAGLCLHDFFVNGVAIFVERDGVYEALNHGRPNHYLSDESLSQRMSCSTSMDTKQSVKFVAGRVTSIHQHCVGLHEPSDGLGTRLNLSEGSRYWTLKCNIISGLGPQVD
eukprot:scaffold97_cov375-Prasinococcus_capsulatus_cf.AAC.2